MGQTNRTIPANGPKTLKEAYQDFFTVGAAVSAHWIDEAAPTLLAHFDTVTCENEMKYNGIHPHSFDRPVFTPGKKPELPPFANKEPFLHPSLVTNFAPADKIYRFAIENGLGVRGHTLVWHGSYPMGAFEQLTPEELRENLEEHFRLLAERYPACFSWDVVNEAIDDRPGGYLRDTVFRQKLGENYLPELYAMARRHFPKQELVCNDYNEFLPEKREKILRLLHTLKEYGVVDTIGCQCHINAHQSAKELEDARRSLDLYAKTGLKIHITEMDVNCLEWGNPTAPLPADIEEKCASVYDSMFRLFREYREAIENVTLWGVSDKYSWLQSFHNDARQPNFPLLFDKNYQPKEALLRVIQF